MSHFRRLTVVEWLTILALTTVLGALLRDPTSDIRRTLEKRASDFRTASLDRPMDPGIVATDVDIDGLWTCRRHLSSSRFTFTPRGVGRFVAKFSNSGCLAGSELQRGAAVENELIRLDAAVAEYVPKTYNALYVIRIQDSEYLLPADGIAKVGSSRKDSFLKGTLVPRQQVVLIQLPCLPYTLARLLTLGKERYACGWSSEMMSIWTAFLTLAEVPRA